MSYYPPGVTGNEYAIAGPDSEREEDRDVVCGGECDFDGTVEGMRVTYRREAWFSWTCPECGADHQEDLDDEDDEREPDEPDYDYEPDYWP